MENHDCGDGQDGIDFCADERGWNGKWMQTDGDGSDICGGSVGMGVICVPVQVSGLSGEVKQVGWWIQFLSLAKSVTAFVVAVHNCWPLVRLTTTVAGMTTAYSSWPPP